MRLRFLLFFTIALLFSALGLKAQVQDGTVSGKITERGTKVEVPFANIRVTNGVQSKVAVTDFDGTYKITGLTPGTYTLSIQAQGFRSTQITGVEVIGDKTQTVNAELETNVKNIEKAVEVIAFKKPLFIKDQTSIDNVKTAAELQKTPVKGINYAVGTSSGANAANGGISIRGGRSNGTVYYIDGVKVTGSGLGLPQGSIEQLSVITGGIPAEYGDATGGIISVTTKGPSNRYSGGFDVQTSKYLDAYNYNSLEGNFSGPLLKKAYKSRDGKDSTKRSILGFFISGIFNYSTDAAPSNVPIYTANDATLKSLETTPLTKFADANSFTGFTFLPAASYVDKSQMSITKYRFNATQFNYNVTGKIDFQPTPTINFTVGGSAFRQTADAYIPANQLFNTKLNPQVLTENYRIYGRIRQTFIQNSDPKASIKNAYYTLQFDYQNNYSETRDKDLKTNFFQYGYIGKFDQYKSRFYIPQTKYYRDSTGKGFFLKSNYYLGDFNDSIKFTRGGLNPILENYTDEYFQANGRVNSLNAIQQGNGLINGYSPPNVNGLWTGVGTRYGGYAKSSTDQYGINFQTIVDLKKHSIKFGFQYDQRLVRGFNVNANGLWILARQLVNRQLILDTANPIFRKDKEGRPVDTVDFNYKVGQGQSYFDKSLRSYLISKGATDERGNKINQTSNINIDRMNPNELSLGQFSADELLNQGNSYVNYYGYDYKGNVQKGKPALEDFLNDTINRRIRPYSPIYMAGFIQDKFEYKDIVFNIGFRVDRFDASQSVLKDMYSVYPVRTAKEINGQTLGGSRYIKPANIGDNYVPYVNDAINPTSLPLGYRDPSTNRWYDAKGNEVSDVNTLAALNSGQLVPYLAQGATRENYKRPVRASFQDYTPQITYMPRVAFSFPINENSVFFANYNVLTQRPRTGNIASVDDYYFLQQRSTSAVNNPNLKPERRTNYEIGFKQKLSTTSALTIQAFYGEIKDMIQLQRINFAWPISYSTFGNIDFGTVKGLTFIYDLRRLGSSGIELQANYTLQFANGTGSDAGSQANLIELGQPNLRTPLPLDYDVRHVINSTIDYRFGEGSEYTGPRINADGGFGGTLDKILRAIFTNTGAYMVVSARSGTPYSRQGNVTQDVSIGVAQRRTLDGDPNSARLPWNYRFDVTIDKNITFKGKEKKDAFGTILPGKPIMFNVFLTIQNILNTESVFSVYRYTGLANDDGFLSSSLGKQTLNSLVDQSTRQAYSDQYSIKANDPTHYASPRIIRVGARVNF